MNDVRLKAPVELSVAADPGMMLVIRLTTAGVTTRAGLTIDAMDNLKIAAEEACSCLIGQQPAPERLTLRFACEGDALLVRVAACDAAERGHADETELEIVKCILASLADRVTFDVQNGWIRAIELSVNLA